MGCYFFILFFIDVNDNIWAIDVYRKREHKERKSRSGDRRVIYSTQGTGNAFYTIHNPSQESILQGTLLAHFRDAESVYKISFFFKAKTALTVSRNQTELWSEK